jgi:hypothetical protein
MFNVISVLDGFEKLLFEILSWSLFIPKTLIKILWDPDWVSSYVENELSKEKERFSEYISPLILLPIIVIGIYGLMEISGRRWGEINGPDTSLVGEDVTFYAEPIFRWRGKLIGEVWEIFNETERTKEFELLRYGDTEYSEMIDFEKLITEYEHSESLQKKNYINDVSSQLTYTWLEPGRYTIYVSFFSSAGENTEFRPAAHQINVFAQDQTPEGVSQNVDNNSRNQNVFSSRERAFTVALIALLLPLWLGICEELLKGKKPDRNRLKRNIYIQSLYVAPLALVIVIAALAENHATPLPPNWIASQMNISMVFSIFALGFAIATVAWFLIAEARYLSNEIGISVWLGGVTAMFLVIMVLLLILLMFEKKFWVYCYVITLTGLFGGIVLRKIFPGK